VNKKLICTVIGILVGVSLGNATIIESFEYQWLIYDTDLNSLVPFLSKEHRNFYRRHLLISPHQYPDAYFDIYADNGSYLFINNKLYGTFSDSGYLSIPNQYIISLNANDSAILVTIHHVRLPVISNPKGFFRLSTPFITSSLPAYTDTTAYRNSSFKDFRVKVLEKKVSSFLFIFPFGILMFLAFGNIIRNYFFNTRAFVRYLSSFFRYRTDIRKIDVGSLLMYFMFYGMTLSYVMMYIPHNLGTGEFYVYLISCIIIFLIIKVILMYLLGYLHNHNQLAQVHLQETIFISILIGSLFLLLGLLAYSHPLVFDEVVVRYGILFLLFFQVFLIIFKVNRLLDIKKLYLISYFCGTELLPIVIFIKSFVK